MTDIKKIYWNISELAKMLNVSFKVIYRMEKEYREYLGDYVGKHNQRKYTEVQVERFKRIYELERGDKIEILRKLENSEK